MNTQNPIDFGQITSLHLTIPGFVSGSSKAQIAIFCLAAVILLDLVSIVTDYMEFILLNNIDSASEQEINSNDNRQMIIGLATLGMLLVTATFFLIWLHRANKNLSPLGVTGMKFTPGWAVGYWFIPIMNIYRPYQVVEEIWKASSPEPESNLSWQSLKTPNLIQGWWGALILSGFAANASARLVSGQEPSLEMFKTSSIIAIVAGVIDILAAVLAIKVIKSIDERQSAKSTKMAMSGTVPAPYTQQNPYPTT